MIIKWRLSSYQSEVRNLSISAITKVEKKSGLRGDVGERDSGDSDLRDILCVCVCVWCVCVVCVCVCVCVWCVWVGVDKNASGINILIKL